MAVVARRKAPLEALVHDIAAAGGAALALEGDVNDVATHTRLYDDIERALGPVDILVNNAGMANDKPAVEVTPEIYDQLMSINMRAAYFLSTELARRLIAAKRPGNIINISSVAGSQVQTGLTLYCLSKAALSMTTRSLAREWARFDIAVNALAPGYIETEMTGPWFKTEGGLKQIKGFPRRRLQPIQSLDGILLLLASRQGQGFTGSVVQVDDGQYI